MELSQKILSDITAYMKYAKYIPTINRRETFKEIVDRNKEMHLKKFPKLRKEIEEAYKYVYDRRVLPSMRSMQFAGKPIELNNSRIFNCSYLPVDDYRAFSEIIFLLLSGCFEPTTELMTKDGDKQIQDITINDYVMTYDIEQDVYRWVKPKFAGRTFSAHKQKIELTLENGKTIKCTEDHEFYTSNRGWVKAKDLTEEDDIQMYDKNKLE